MRAAIEDSHVVFRLRGTEVARYFFADQFKPHFCSLRTPAGHETTLVCPGDHRHHKGLMYALKCADLNFWEEGEGQGVQEVLATELLPAGDGFAQELLWRRGDGALPTYRETRTVKAIVDPGRSSVRYEWRTRRRALRDHRLVKSEWSLQLPDGRSVNYHGLGIRLPWMWAFPFPDRRFGGVECGGSATTAAEACGSSGPSCGFWGLIDGCWERTVASVTMSQPTAQGFTWFVLRRDFPYLSVGPSNHSELDVAEGFVTGECYGIEVRDLPASHEIDGV